MNCDPSQPQSKPWNTMNKTINRAQVVSWGVPYGQVCSWNRKQYQVQSTLASVHQSQWKMGSPSCHQQITVITLFSKMMTLFLFFSFLKPTSSTVLTAVHLPRTCLTTTLHGVVLLLSNESWDTLWNGSGDGIFHSLKKHTTNVLWQILFTLNWEIWKPFLTGIYQPSTPLHLQG